MIFPALTGRERRIEEAFTSIIIRALFSGSFDALVIFLALTGQENGPVHNVEEEVERGEKEKHPLVNDPSPLLRVLLLLGKVVLLHVEADEGELHPVDNYCSEDEEEVDEDPKSQGSQSLRDLNRG